MAGRLTVQERVQIGARYEVWNSGWVTEARRSGRPSTSRSEENVALARDMFTRRPCKSARQAARESELSRHKTRTVLKEDLNFRPRKPHYMQEMTPEDCDRRMKYGKLMLGWHEYWPEIFENILWSDEAVFHIGGFVSRHSCHYWAAHDPEVTVEKLQNRPKVTVWCGMMANRVIGPYRVRDTMNAERYLQMLEDYVWPIVSGWEKHLWTCFHARWRTATLCIGRTCLVGSEVSGTLVGTTRTSRMACKKSRSHALWLFPVGLGKGGGVPGKTPHNGTIAGPDSERYHQRPIRLPAEDCGFHSRSFEEAGGCRRCLHWILSYAPIFPFKKHT